MYRGQGPLEPGARIKDLSPGEPVWHKECYIQYVFHFEREFGCLTLKQNLVVFHFETEFGELQHNSAADSHHSSFTTVVCVMMDLLLETLNTTRGGGLAWKNASFAKLVNARGYPHTVWRWVEQ